MSPLASGDALIHLFSMHLPGFPRITVDPAVCGGRPTVAGTRLRVSDVLEMLADGVSAAQIATDFPYVSEADVRAVLAFVANQPHLQ